MYLKMYLPIWNSKGTYSYHWDRDRNSLNHSSGNWNWNADWYSYWSTDWNLDALHLNWPFSMIGKSEAE